MGDIALNTASLSVLLADSNNSETINENWKQY